MCGRYVVDPRTGIEHWEPALDQSGQAPKWISSMKKDFKALPSRNDVRPTQQVPVIRGGHEAIDEMQWWFVPSWAPDPDAWRKKVTTFNARVEGLAESKTYRAAWRAGRRCVLPMRGYYEWRVIDPSKPRAKKERNYIAPADGRWLFAAGLWEHWQHGEADPVDSCTMITTTPHDDLAYIHDRSPLLIPENLLDDWLHAGADAAMALLQAIDFPNLTTRVVDGPVEI